MVSGWEVNCRRIQRAIGKAFLVSRQIGAHCAALREVRALVNHANMVLAARRAAHAPTDREMTARFPDLPNTQPARTCSSW
jgi:hypothetical protein